MRFENEKLLVIAPHPDDETLGCFGLMDRVRSSGGAVFVQVMTAGGYERSDGQVIERADWQEEFARACAEIGVAGQDIMLTDETFRSLDSLPLSSVIQYLEHRSPLSLRNIQPTLVAVPTMYSTHQDHIIAYKAAMTALRTNPVKGRRPPGLILAYEAPEYNLWSPYVELGNFSPNFFLPLSAESLQRKCAVLEMYQTQMKEGKRGVKAVRIQAEMRGYQTGCDYAEAFSVQRAIV